MYCGNCGSSVNVQSNFCNGCGAKVLTQVAEKPETNQTNLPDQTNLIEKLVGKNSAFYMNRWARPNRKSGWNWAAFLLGPLWMGYRKIYKDLIMVLSIYYVAYIVLIFMGQDTLGNIAFVGINATMGLSGNAYYRKHIDNQQQKHLNNASMYPINKIGGTSWGGVFIAIGLILAGAVITALITGF